jgi:hypothetical protein|eukprot:SAG25_NODE_1515_length_2858_cov_1.637187_2_plen_153_part_00
MCFTAADSRAGRRRCCLRPTRPRPGQTEAKGKVARCIEILRRRCEASEGGCTPASRRHGIDRVAQVDEAQVASVKARRRAVQVPGHCLLLLTNAHKTGGCGKGCEVEIAVKVDIRWRVRARSAKSVASLSTTWTPRSASPCLRRSSCRPASA